MHIEIHNFEVDKQMYLCPSIKMFLTGKNDRPQEISVIGFNGTIKVWGRVVQEIPLQINEFKADPGQSINPGNVYVECSDAKTHQIEKLRKGGDVDLSVNLTFQTGQQTWEEYERYSERASAKSSISQRKWCTLLDEMGYGKRRILEIPNPVVAEAQPLQNGIATLENAASLLRQGQNEEAFKKCRDVLDAFFPEFNEGPSGTPVKFSQDFVNRLDGNSTPGLKSGGEPWPNKSKYIDDLRKQIRNLSNIGHHGNYQITPEDAELMVFLCWDLCSFLSKEYAKSVDEWPRA